MDYFLSAVRNVVYVFNQCLQNQMISIIKGMYGILTDTYNIQFIEAEKKWQLFHGKHFQTHFNENVCVVIKISLNFNFVPSGPIDNSPTLVQVMAWHLKGDKPLTNQ